jgi:hypothetical protein
MHPDFEGRQSRRQGGMQMRQFDHSDISGSERGAAKVSQTLTGARRILVGVVAGSYEDPA